MVTIELDPRQLRALWPALKGSLSRVRKPCIRPRCRACARGTQHRAWLLAFTQQSLKKAPSVLALDDLDTKVIGAFLDHIEKDRGNSPRTRNARLAAIHSFFQYAALQAPDHSAVIQRVLAMQGKKYNRSLVHFLPCSPSRYETGTAISRFMPWPAGTHTALLPSGSPAPS